MSNVVFEELGEKEKSLLLKAFDYDVDDKGYILDSSGQKIRSEENHYSFLHIKGAGLMPGSLKVIDGTPTAISKFLRERVEENGCNTPD
ncbi:MAG: hypothetical protein KAK00_02450 [Nanoarchaeota archaeon]|nr:hypothetical protein [Nanoarchaeota archaeon]